MGINEFMLRIFLTWRIVVNGFWIMQTVLGIEPMENNQFKLIDVQILEPNCGPATLHFTC